MRTSEHLKMMNRLILLLPLWLCLLVACQEEAPQQGPDPQTLDAEALEKAVLDRISALPEVKQLTKDIHEYSSGRASVELFLVQTPSDTANYYRVAVAENVTGRFNPVFQFDVFPKENWRLMHYNPRAQEQLDIEDWRAAQKALQQ